MSAPRRMRAPAAGLSDEDRGFMQQALALAERGRGATRPNPMVGAVIVDRGHVIARGYHHRAGEAHGEVDALRKVDLRAPGATLYVTLEPCCHQGRTGPCTEPVIASGIRRVVVGCLDANPKVSGRGIARLRRAGLRVDVGCLEEACFRLNRGFFRWIHDRRPWVTLKAAATLDGFIAPLEEDAGTKAPRWITNGASRARAHALRAEHDAIVVGAGTVLADDPRLTVRLPRGRRAPEIQRVVLDGRLRTPPTARLFEEKAGPPVLVVTRAPEGLSSSEKRSALRRTRALERSGARVLALPAAADGRVAIADALRALAELGLQSLLVEGGSEVHGAFIAARLVDEVAVFLAPRLDGAGLPIARGPGLPFAAPLRLGPLAAELIGGDILLRATAQDAGLPERLSAARATGRSRSSSL